MEKAYSLEELGKILKKEAEKEGLTIAEEAVEKLGKAVWTGVKKWVKESSAISENKIDDIAAPFMDTLDGLVEGVVEGIDLDKDGD